MARIEDKIAEIADSALRQAIAEEVAKLKKRTRFGLVFEEHQPEVVPIHGARIKRGERVALRSGNLTDIWRVLSVRGGQAHCEKERGNVGDLAARETFDERQLIVVRRMGEAIYPALTPIDVVANADQAQPHHLLIEADNYHALQLMLFAYEGKVDCIYIDPPYNTGARDWKYNNDYVDENDRWQHSKWLSMMKRRLQLSLQLLKPTGIIVITIDDCELHRLISLVQDHFSGPVVLGTVLIRNTPQGRATTKGFAISHEYAVFVGATESAEIGRLARSVEQMARYNQSDEIGPFEWVNFRKPGGTFTYRVARPKQFYPIYFDTDGLRIPRLEWQKDKREWRILDKPRAGEAAIWPIDGDGNERIWSYGHETARDSLDQLLIRPDQLGRPGVYRKLRPNLEGSLPSCWWDSSLYSATEYGTNFLRRVFAESQVFPFPKSVYAVADALRVASNNNPNALIVDYFAGSGTTLNAVNLLNATEGGQRQCILVTNNEVSEEEARNLTAQGFQPGQSEWDRHGICRSVTWPRSKFTILGRRDDGSELTGDYLTGKQTPRDKPRSIRLLGFAEGRNLTVPQRKQVAALLPAVPQSKVDDSPWFLDDTNAVSVLWDVQQASAWLDELAEADHVTEICVVTSESKLFNALKAQIAETLGPQSITEDEKRPLADGFPANLDYFRLDFLDPQEVQMGRQFAAILPILWMMAGARGPRPNAPDAHAPWLLPVGCPFAVLMQETRFKDFVRHVEGRADLTHVFVVTNSQNTVHKLRREWPALRVVQLYKDYLENFRINLPENPAP